MSIGYQGPGHLGGGRGKRKKKSQSLSFPHLSFVMDITDYYRADLNELDAPDSPTMGELEIEAFGMWIRQ